MIYNGKKFRLSYWNVGHLLNLISLNEWCSLSTAICRGLSVGVNCNCVFSALVCHDVFMFLFGDYGSAAVSCKCGKMYNRPDFTDNYFISSDFVYYNKHNECVGVVFTIYMYSYVKFIRCDNIIDFCETNSPNLIKERC